MIATAAAREVTVRGVVQGVGFRPFVHRLARRFGLAGWVRNTDGIVEIHVEGEPGALDGFEAALRAEAPPLAAVAAVRAHAAAATGAHDFQILASAAAAAAGHAVPPDVAMCPACAAELADPADRRHRHPFLTCTDCGPRYSVIEALPYDRVRTSMRAFAPCPACAAEYARFDDRRYHAETVSCPACGPRLWYEGPGGVVDGAEAALAAAARLLLEGGILALRGMGGFHLAADATDEHAVSRLRLRKHRAAKPFAVMVRTVDEARALAHVDDAAAALLEAPDRPVVLLPARPEGALAPAVAPGITTLGLLLPSTPVHQLLLESVGAPLVMTSGNRAEEPIVAGLDEARTRLADTADAFLFHDREIVARVDDSVVRPAPGGAIVVRRARGRVPVALTLPVASPVPLLAAGPHLKHTFTLVDGDTAWCSPHLGDLEDLATLEHARRTVAHFERLFGITPRAAAVDLHPAYLSRRLAEGIGEVVEVQHHHAHIAAVLAEHGERGPVVGVACDGTGAGDDGTIWGCEVLVADLEGYRREARLRPAPLPGGDLAARTPWRAALGYTALDPVVGEAWQGAWAGQAEALVSVARTQTARRLNAPLASSLGRLFDAAAAILGLRQESSYEGQAAMELEALAGHRHGEALPFPWRQEGVGPLELDPVPLLVALAEGRARGEDPAELAAGFHEAVAEGLATVVMHVADGAGCGTVALGGGSFQNRRLLTRLADRLAARGLRVLRPRALPPNDGAISVGQAAVAAARLARQAGRD